MGYLSRNVEGSGLEGNLNCVCVGGGWLKRFSSRSILICCLEIVLVIILKNVSAFALVHRVCLKLR